jgi:DNA polymerase
MAKHIGRDIHKMHAFVRFRKVNDTPETNREQFVAWFETEHRIVRLTSAFFRKRFTGMDWSILTPDECMHWDGQKIHFTDGVDKTQAPNSDSLDELWKTYYRNIFNPARLKVKAMQSEMPKKYWKNLPEAEIIKELIASSSDTTREMLATPSSPVKPAPEDKFPSSGIVPHDAKHSSHWRLLRHRISGKKPFGITRQQSHCHFPEHFRSHQPASHSQHS